MLEDTAPWSKIKSDDEEEKTGAAQTLLTALEAARIVAVLLAPVIPNLSATLLAQLGCEQTWQVCICVSCRDRSLHSQHAQLLLCSAVSMAGQLPQVLP